MQKEHSKKTLKDIKYELKEKIKLCDNYLNKLEYLQADFENYKKIVEKEKIEYVKFANEKVIIKLLSVLDDLEFALLNITDKKDKNGIRLIFNNFNNILNNFGLKKIDIADKKFDPNCCEAVSIEETDDDDQTILDEIQSGYILNDKVIRYAKVKISKIRG